VDVVKISLHLGHAVAVLGTLGGFISLYFATHTLASARFVFTVMTFFSLWYFPHTLFHYIVGKLLGINFSYYFVGRTNLRKLIKPVGKIPIPLLGIKIDRNSFGKVGKWRKRMMFLAGVFASMFLPTLCLIVSQSYPYNIVVLFIAFGNIVFTFPTSYLVGDIWKARKVKD